jgi:hypothetical protein
MDTEHKAEADTTSGVHEMVKEFLDSSRGSTVERRESARYPYYCTASLNYSEPALRIPCYVYDLSQKGVGLIHGTRVQLGSVTLELMPPKSQHLIVEVNIIWCRKTGASWYRSGGELIRVIDAVGAPMSDQSSRNPAVVHSF